MGTRTGFLVPLLTADGRAVVTATDRAKLPGGERGRRLLMKILQKTEKTLSSFLASFIRRDEHLFLFDNPLLTRSEIMISHIRFSLPRGDSVD